MTKAMTMPDMRPSSKSVGGAVEDASSPISMSGIAAALHAAEANKKSEEDNGDDSDWSDS